MRGVTLKQLRALRAVADTGSVTAAARQLFVTAPAISMQIRQFEQIAGLPLLERAGEKFVLTGAGREALRASRTVDAAIDEFETALEKLRGGVAGHVSVGLVSTAKYFAPRMVGAFARTHPGVKVSITVGNREQVLKALRDFSIDIAIMGRPPADQSCAADPIGDHPHVIVADPGHRLARRRRFEPKLLQPETFVVREPGSGTRNLMERFFEQAGVAPRYGLEIDSNETIKQAVMAGLGVSVQSAASIDLELETGRLVILDVVGFPLHRVWHAVHPEGRRLTHTASAFLAFLQSQEWGAGRRGGDAG